MFDELRSSYDLGPQFTDVPMQTKDIEYGIGGTLSNYWISPDGILYLINYSGTTDFVEIKEDDPEYNKKLGFLNFKNVPNGNHGKVTPQLITKYVTAYVTDWEGDYWDRPTVKLHFKYGKLQDFEDVTGKRYD